ARNAMKPPGQWNHIVVTCNKNLIEVELNGARVTRMNLDEFTRPYLRPDGTKHKFDVAYKDHPRKGYIGLQDHGSPCWFKNIKLKPLAGLPAPAGARHKPAAYERVVLASRPVAYWPLNDPKKGLPVAKDATGHKQDGRYHNNPRHVFPGVCLDGLK